MSGTRPVIGICAAIESAQWAAWEVEVNLSPRTYSLAVQRAGGLALILPPDDVVAESPDEVLDMLDGLILAGGSDIDPGSYGAQPNRRRVAPAPSATASRSPWARARLSATCPCSGSAAACR